MACFFVDIIVIWMETRKVKRNICSSHFNQARFKMDRIPESVLVRGKNCFTQSELFARAAALKGLKMQNPSGGNYSQSFREYKIGPAVLARLAEKSITRQARPENDGVYTLVDNNPQQQIPGWTPSNYWNFGKRKDDDRKFDLRFSLSVRFKLSIRERGIVFLPQVSATLCSSDSDLSNRWAFEALVEDDDRSLPDVAKQIARSQEGRVVVSWTEMGLGGLRMMVDLFLEVAKHKENVFALGQAKKSIFNPAPIAHDGEGLFVAEPAQPMIFMAWEKQLKAYRESLYLE
jgi:hypothetical protein